MPRTLAPIAACIALAVVTAALAANPRGETIKYNAADQAAARAATVQRADLQKTSGWKGGATKPDLSATSCADYNPDLSHFVSTGAAASDWLLPDEMEVSSQTDVLQTAQMVRREWQVQVQDPAALACGRRQAAKAFAAHGAKLISYRRISVPHIAPQVAAYWLLVRPVGGEFALEDLQFDKGRTEVDLQVIGPPDAAQGIKNESLRLASRLLGRIKS